MTLRPGDDVRLWWPRNAWHGARGRVLILATDGRVVTIDGWWLAGMVTREPREAVSEAEYQRRRADHPAGGMWPA